MRRLLALILVVAAAGSPVEAAVGVLRDGRVHHEDALSAAVHHQRFALEHDHEDGTPSGEHRQGPGHEHGTTSDHCTHSHNATVPVGFSFSTVLVSVTWDYPGVVTLHSVVADHATPPPRV